MLRCIFWMFRKIAWSIQTNVLASTPPPPHPPAVFSPSALAKHFPIQPRFGPNSWQEKKWFETLSLQTASESSDAFNRPPRIPTPYSFCAVCTPRASISQSIFSIESSEPIHVSMHTHTHCHHKQETGVGDANVSSRHWRIRDHSK